MEYYIQKRSIEQGRAAFVQDSSGNKLFFFTGKIGSPGDSLTLCRMNGERLAKIVQASVVFGTHFDLYLKDEKKGRMIKLINWPKMTFLIPSNKWVVHGDLMSHTYHIQNGSKLIMDMYPATSFLGDIFAIDILNEQDSALCLCIASVLDYWAHNNKKSSIKQAIVGFPFPVS